MPFHNKYSRMFHVKPSLIFK